MERPIFVVYGHRRKLYLMETTQVVSADAKFKFLHYLPHTNGFIEE